MTLAVPPRFEFLELALDDRCNLRCIGCFSCEGRGASLTTQRAAEWLKWGRARGATRLWLGGGEPLLRPDVIGLTRAARALGYREVHVQTNGVRLAYAEVVRALVAAGVTHVRLNLKSHDAAVHDGATSVEGSHALLDAALANLAGAQVALAGDVLLTTETTPALPETVAWYADRGVPTFSLWLLSAADSRDPKVAAAVPSLTDVARALDAAAAVADARGVVLESLHTPPCTLSPAQRARFKPASAWGLVVVDASGAPFSLAASPFEGGAYVDACRDCTLRATCPGPRADYLAIHGAAELTAIT